MKFDPKVFLTNDVKLKRGFSIFGLLAIFAVGFVPVRGLLVLLLNNHSFTSLIYSATLAAILLISLVGIKLSFSSRDLNFPGVVSKLLLTNLVLYLVWLLPVLVINPIIDWVTAPVYLAFMPYLVYLFRLVKVETMTKIIAFVTIIISLSVIWDFVEMNIMLDRYDIAFARQELLRPDNFEAIGRNEALIRPNGLTGSRPHDASNLLAMFFVFWVVKYFFVKTGNRFFTLFLILLSGVSMLATQVASNIIASFLVLALVLPYGFSKQPKNIPYLGIFITTILLIYVFGSYPLLFDALMSGFQRAGSEGDWEGITIFQLNGITDLIITFFLGHAGSFHLFHAAEVTEFAIIRMIFEQGIIHFIVLMLLFCYPYKLFVRNRKKIQPIVLPFVAGFSVGLVSLWHYGSVFRITNGVIFWAMWAQAIVLIQNKKADAGNVG